MDTWAAKNGGGSERLKLWIDFEWNRKNGWGWGRGGGVRTAQLAFDDNVFWNKNKMKEKITVAPLFRNWIDFSLPILVNLSVMRLIFLWTRGGGGEEGR